jgi:hypothetical protein
MRASQSSSKAFSGGVDVAAGPQGVASVERGRVEHVETVLLPTANSGTCWGAIRVHLCLSQQTTNQASSRSPFSDLLAQLRTAS